MVWLRRAKLATAAASWCGAFMLGVAVVWALCVFDEEASAASPTMLG
jgi:hypothetical protein